ncbi:hypothetical protein CYY_002461 [Polysphondylium violaceum]|uniref:Sugar phosphate transporter domain-containing protein n=1 Tax=Polysphondylium violaceum TaxID=133409 RepID=A0A8J4PZB4_9MYCE|nr:hypothetical protein CYY_002461 [Polysphondylium violaceum]
MDVDILFDDFPNKSSTPTTSNNNSNNNNNNKASPTSSFFIDRHLPQYQQLLQQQQQQNIYHDYITRIQSNIRYTPTPDTNSALVSEQNYNSNYSPKFFTNEKNNNNDILIQQEQQQNINVVGNNSNNNNNNNNDDDNLKSPYSKSLLPNNSQVSILQSFLSKFEKTIQLDSSTSDSNHFKRKLKNAASYVLSLLPISTNKYTKLPPQDIISTINNNNNSNITSTTTTTHDDSKSIKNIVFCTFYVVTLYLIYGLLQEILFKKQKVNFFALYSFAQFFVSFLLSVRDIYIKQKSNTQDGNVTHLQLFQRLSLKKIKLYSLLSLILFFTKLLGNEALRYLNFKTKILFQTSKIIPVMIIGGILFKRTYNKKEYMSIFFMISGLLLFCIGESFSSSLMSPLALFLILAYIFVESFKSILYEKILKDFSSEVELSLFTNFFGSVMTLPILFVSKEIKTSILFLIDNKLTLLIFLAFISLGYFANIAYLNLIKITDSFYANMISSFRKFLTILLSFVYFHDSLLFYHAIGILVFFGGLILEIITKSKETSEKRNNKNQ